MQYVESGPDIPDGLNEALDKGRVVFFCGAGISYPAGLPNFARLTKRVYHKLGGTANELQKSALKRRQYDTALDLLERYRPNGEIDVRRAVADILKPKLRRPNAMDTHEALLTLGRTRDGKLRVVTTNFDSIFEAFISKHDLKVERFKAPLLPVPKQSLNGLIYLHGLIEDPVNDALLRRIVITSGDFGRAYLTDRWAARFVSELFRNFTVCFVGYSIDDPVMRYMMDALAADRRSGEPCHEVYAFAGYTPGKHDKTKIEWQTKNVIPIMYSTVDNHALLYKSIQEWSWKYRDGLQGRRMLITEHAGTEPISNSRFDYAVGRVLWALCDKQAAKHFAEMDPCPPLGWLGPLDEAQYVHDDLGRFGVPPGEHKKDELTFSYLRRFTPYHLAPHMVLVNFGETYSGVDKIMVWLAVWLTRHLNNPDLIAWLVKRGGRLHPTLADTIRRRIDEIKKLEDERNDVALKRLAESAPNAIPNKYMRKVLQLFVEGRVKSHTHNSDIYQWRSKFAKSELTPDLRMELRELLTPYVVFRERHFWPGSEEVNPKNPKRVKDIVDWEIALAAESVHHAIGDNFKPGEWHRILSEFLPTASTLLRDVMDIMRMLDGAGDYSDLSYYHQPSISEHEQNRDFHDWTVLVKFCRDGWREVAAKDAAQALAYAVLWFNVPYPLFKRLAFFCAAQEQSPVPRAMALEWLIGAGAWWLWSVETQREVMRLVVAISPRLNQEEQARLETAILQGPPREMYKQGLTQEEWERRVKYQIWHLLAKVDSVISLGTTAQAKFDAVRQEDPMLALDENQIDEFPFSMGTGYGRELRGPAKITVPTTETEMLQWLRDHPTSSIFEEDNWDERCRKDSDLAAKGLQKLATEGNWPEERWRTAIQVWSEGAMLEWSWRVLPSMLGNMPEPAFKEIAHSVSHWLKSQARSFADGEDNFFALCKRLLAVPDTEKPSLMEPVTDALNNPGGEATQALFIWWYRQNLKDGIGLDERLKAIFTTLSDRSVWLYRHARIFLTLQVVALFRVDEQWARTHILQLFDWNISKEDAVRAWAGFLWSPQLFLPFIAAVKPYFLGTAAHYNDLRDRDGDQYAHLLTYISLDPAGIFETTELSKAVGSLPPEGLVQALIAVVNGLKSAGERREDYWVNRVEQFMKNIWPQDKSLISEAIATRMAQLCIAAGVKFPEALSKLGAWLIPVRHSFGLFMDLKKSSLCTHFPVDALEFMSKLTAENTQYLSEDFNECLNEISKVNPILKEDQRYKTLELIYDISRL